MLTGFQGRDPFTATAKFTTLFRTKVNNDAFARACVWEGCVCVGGGGAAGVGNELMRFAYMERKIMINMRRKIKSLQ